MALWWVICTAAFAAAPLAVQAVVLVGNTSGGQSLMRRELMQNDFNEVNPPESARRYSSIWSNNAIGQGHARSMLGSPQAWSAATNDKNQWVILDLGERMAVGGVYFQARQDAPNQIVTEAHFETSWSCQDYTPVDANRIFRTGVAPENAGKYLVRLTKPRVAKCIKVWPDLWEHHISLRVGVFARTPTGDDLSVAGRAFRAVNSPEASRTYSSIWGNNAIGTGHATSMLDSPQGWSAAHSRKGEWVNIDMGEQMTVEGAYFQARNRNTQWGNQMVTGAYFEYSKDCVDYTPVARSEVFATLSVPMTDHKSFVRWPGATVAKCIRVGVDGWEHHISMRVAPSARTVAAEDRVYEQFEFLASNPAEAMRTYSSVWDNNGIGQGHARSMLDSPQAWSSARNDPHQWVIIQLQDVQNVNGAYFQSRNDRSGGGNQIVTQVKFKTSLDCIDYAEFDDGQVYATGLTMFDDLKRFVKWPVEMLAKCVQVQVVGWAHHISMRVGLSVGRQQPSALVAMDEEPVGQALVAMDEGKAVSTTAMPAPAVVEGVSFDHYGDGSPAHLAEDFDLASDQSSYSVYEDGTPAHTAEDFVNTSQVGRFDFYGDGTPTRVA